MACLGGPVGVETNGFRVSMVPCDGEERTTPISGDPDAEQFITIEASEATTWRFLAVDPTP